MKQAVLYVCHGSRVKEARDEAIAFITRCQKWIKADLHEICFLELASPSIEEGFSSCVKQGATHIAVVPLLLLTAVHAKKDIPLEIEKTAQRFPAIEITYGKPIGVHPKLAESVLERVTEQQPKHTASSLIVLIGRGSSDPDVSKDLQAIAKLVKNQSGIEDIRTCYLTAATPSFEDTLAELIQVKGKEIYFVPYLLFTGILMKNIKAKVSYARQQNDKIQLCRYLGYDSRVEAVFKERVTEAIQNDHSTYSFKRGARFDATVND
jgi:sirohydrochlorin ferrochelatase